MINKLEELDKLKGQYQYSFNNLKKLELQVINLFLLFINSLIAH